MNKLSLYIIMLLCCMCFCTSCIDEYDVDVKDLSQKAYVIEGEICSNSQNCLHVSQVIGLNDNSSYYDFYYVTNARLTITGSDGSKYLSNDFTGDGRIYINVGELKEDVDYTVEVMINDVFFRSKPLKALFTEDIDSISFTPNKDRSAVDILISTKNPGNEVKYYKWIYEENWEINTPFVLQFLYDPETGEVNRYTGDRLDVGYCYEYQHKSIFGSNLDYGKGGITEMKLYDIPVTDDRLQTLYRTRVKQFAISNAEYEYLRTSKIYTDDMGGLFTPQPSLISSDFKCIEYGGKEVSDGDKSGNIPILAGFVGLRGNYSVRDLYIHRGQTDYKNTHEIKIIDQKEIDAEGYSWAGLYRRGYWVLTYITGALNEISWAPRWCFDATDPVWGAYLYKPNDWPN